MLGEHTLANGRRFLIEDTGESFDHEPSAGGYAVKAYNSTHNIWVDCGNYENMSQVERFLSIAEWFTPFAE